MADETVSTPVVSGATEAPAPVAEPSSTGTQTGDATASTTETTAPQTAAEKKRLRDLLKDDPDLRAEYDAELQRHNARQKRRWDTQRLKENAQAAVDNDDADSAIEVARRVAAQADDDDDGPASGARKVAEVQSDAAFIGDPDYKAIYAHDKGLVAQKFKELSAAEFKTWARTEGRRVTIQAEVQDAIKKALPTIQKAALESAVNETLRDVVVPMTGGPTGTGALTLERYESMSLADRLKLKRENPALIDQMVAHASR